MFYLSFLTNVSFHRDEKINAKDYIDSLHEQRHQYEGFNCILGNVNELWYYSNRDNKPKPIQLQPGKVRKSIFLNDIVFFFE
jgi:uncharacterized protein with NRDE domain